MFKVITKLNKFYSDEVYFKVRDCKTWEEVCRTVDPIYYFLMNEGPTPIKHYVDSFYGETWIFKGREIGCSSCPDTITHTVFVDGAGQW